MPKEKSWTVKTLQRELVKRKIPFQKHTRKDELLALYESSLQPTAEHHVNFTEQSDSTELLKSSPVQVQNKDGQVQVQDKEAQGVNTTGESNLASTMSAMLNTMSSISNTMSALASSFQQRASDPSMHAQSTQEYTLSSALQTPPQQQQAINPPSFGLLSPRQEMPSASSSDGVPMSSLPQVEIISPQIRKDIIAGKDINLVCLLLPGYSEEHNRHVIVNDQVIPLKPLTDHRLQKSLTISEFILAFSIYKNVMCEAFPNRRGELDAYERIIVEMATKFPGNGFFEYHKLFSAKAAVYLRNYNVKVNWGIRDEYIFNSIFAGHKANSCGICSSMMHSTTLCPNNLSSPKGSQRNLNASHTDIRGRPRIMYQGKEICNNFNS